MNPCRPDLEAVFCLEVCCIFKWKNMTMLFRRIIAGVALAAALAACGGAPEKEAVAASISKILPGTFEVLSLSPVNGIAGLFEVRIMANKQPVVLYVNRNATLVFSGNIIDPASKQNLTLEAQKKLTGK